MPLKASQTLADHGGSSTLNIMFAFGVLTASRRLSSSPPIGRSAICRPFCQQHSAIYHSLSYTSQNQTITSLSGAYNFITLYFRRSFFLRSSPHRFRMSPTRVSRKVRAVFIMRIRPESRWQKGRLN